MVPGINKKTLILIFKIAVSGLCLYVVFKKSDIKQIYSILTDIGVFYFLFVAFLYVVSQLASTFRWKLLLPEHFTVRKLFSLYMIGSFFSSFLPGVIGGDAIRAYYLNKDAKKISLTLASIFMDRYLGYVSLMTIGITAFPFSLQYFGASPYKWLMPLIFTAFVLGSFLFFGLQLGRRFRMLSEFYDYFILLKTRKDIIIKAILISFFIQFLNFLMIIIFAFVIGENIPLLVLFVFMPIVITLMTLPISISGLGVREGAFVLLLGLIGIRPEVATSISLAWFFSIFLGSLPGLFAYMRHTKDTGTA